MPSPFRVVIDSDITEMLVCRTLTRGLPCNGAVIALRAGSIGTAPWKLLLSPVEMAQDGDSRPTVPCPPNRQPKGGESMIVTEVDASVIYIVDDDVDHCQSLEWLIESVGTAVPLVHVGQRVS